MVYPKKTHFDLVFMVVIIIAAQPRRCVFIPSPVSTCITCVYLQIACVPTALISSNEGANESLHQARIIVSV